MKYSVIVFDLGSVLIPFDYTKAIERINKAEEGLGNKFARLYAENYEFHRDFERGKISREKFLDKMCEWLEGKVDREEFCRIFSDIFTTNDDVIKLLPVLKKNYKLVLLSNTNEIHEEYGYSHYEFLKYFDKLFLSHKVGAVKPEEKIYRAVESYTGMHSSEHFFIDDVQEYVDGARRCGWDAARFVDYNTLIHDLKIRRINLDGLS
ncbi:HAD family hydrolase [Melioribacter sp. Ez-97]|uniref:HAD family hydrolase n=1 Tax=Melioribacter sp. Ez-97 TaxID=3423434 RepID=UPI003EDB26E4